MTEQEQIIKELVEDAGISREEAELVLRDEDLWLVEPGRRFGFEGEEAVRQWHDAAAFVKALVDGFTTHGAAVVNEATVQLLWDLEVRADEALRRAHSRLGTEEGTGTAFGEVLEEYMERAGITGVEELVARIKQETQWEFDAHHIEAAMRVWDAVALGPEYFQGIEKVLGLSREELTKLAVAYGTPPKELARR